MELYFHVKQWNYWRKHLETY